MIREGDAAPEFELPGYVDGEGRRVALEEFLGEDVVVLAFYPADFNAACDRESGLDALDLFTMQKDVSVLAVGPDSVASHAAFAEEYNLTIPLLSDTRREVAEAYGVAREDDLGQHLVERAAFVIDHDGTVAYAWSDPDPTALPDVEAVKDAISDSGGDDTAFARYRVGHAHYMEGRRAFTTAMEAYDDSEWMMAQTDFVRAREEFDEAAEHFDSAVRFVDDADTETYYRGATEKANSLWQTADWMGKSASAYSKGEGAEGRALRDDAQRPLETAREIGDPLDPDEWPPEDEEMLTPGGTGGDDGGFTIDEEPADPSAADEEWSGGAKGGPDEDAVDIDDEELEQIEAELADEGDEEAAATEEGAGDAADADDEEIDEDELAALEAEIAGEEGDAE